MRFLVLINSILWIAWLSLCLSICIPIQNVKVAQAGYTIVANTTAIQLNDGCPTSVVLNYNISMFNSESIPVDGSFYLQWADVGTNSWETLENSTQYGLSFDPGYSDITVNANYIFTSSGSSVNGGGLCNTKNAIIIRGVFNPGSFPDSEYLGESSSKTILFDKFIPEVTNTPVGTSIPTVPPQPTNTPTSVPTNTFTAQPTDQPTNTPTATSEPTAVPTNTPTWTAIPTIAPTQEQPTATPIPAIPAPNISIDNLFNPSFGSEEVTYLVTITTPGYAGNIDKYVVDSIHAGIPVEPMGLNAQDGIQFNLTLQKGFWDGQLIKLHVDTIVSDPTQYSNRYNSQSASWWIAFPGPTNTPTHTPTSTNTSAPTPTHTQTSTPGAEATPTPTIPTNTPVPPTATTEPPTSTPVPTAPATNTPAPAEATPTPTASQTNTATATSTRTPTNTSTPTSTFTPTVVEPEATPTPTGTNSPTPTSTATTAPTATEPPTPTPGNTATPIPTNTPTPIVGVFGRFLSDGFKLFEGAG